MADSDEIIEVMQRMRNDEAMIKHLTSETNFCIDESLAGASQSECESKHVTYMQIRQVLVALADNTDFTHYTD